MIEAQELKADIISNSTIQGEIGKTIEVIPPYLQEKTATPTSEAQVILPDENYNGLSKVNIEAISPEYIIPTGTETITSNGTYNIKEKEFAEVHTTNSTTVSAGSLNTVDNSGFVRSILDGLDEVQFKTTSAYCSFCGYKGYSMPKLTSTKTINNLSSTFQGCTNITKVDLSGCTIQLSQNMGATFKDCNFLAVIDLSTLDLNGYDFTSSTFSNCGNDCTQESGAWRNGRPYVYVKDAYTQGRVLSYKTGWTTSHVIVKGN